MKNENRMKIVFHSLNNKNGSFGVDSLFHGLHKLGHEIIDLPKREQCYADGGDNYFTRRGFWRTKWIKDDPLNGLRHKYSDDGLYINLLKEADLILYDNAQLYLHMLKKNPFINKFLTKTVCMLTNDGYTRAPLPNIRMDKKTPMLIREKSIQAPNINIPEINDFNLVFCIDEQDCFYTKPSDKTKGVFMSMSLYGDRKEYAKEYNNQFKLNKNDYYSKMRQHKYGLSCPGQGFKCQRDSELGGNTLLCIYKQPKWDYSFNDYRGGVNCIEYESLKDLKEQIKYYDEHDDEYEKLLKACYEHTLKYCTKKSQVKEIIRWFNER